MYAYVVKLVIIRHALGIIRPETFYAKHVRFIFPGKNSWAGEFEGKVAVGAWLRRSHQADLKIEPHEIIVGGPPWNMTVCVRITDHAKDSNGNVVYQNRTVLFGTVPWG